MEPFGFGLDESSELSKRLYEQFDTDCSGWRKVDEVWRQEKGELMAALSPTGRVEKQVVVIHSVYDRRVQLEESELGRLMPMWWLTDADIEAGGISEENPIVKEKARYAEHWYGNILRKGMKLSRAAVAWLLAYEAACLKNNPNYSFLHGPHTRDQASAVVGKVFEEWNSGSEHTLVLSANIWDILSASYHCGWSSCHRPDGEYRGGPLQYLCDNHTLVAYIYKMHRVLSVNGRNYNLPFKVWRQMIHIDRQTRSAAFMRQYGSCIHDQTHLALRDMVEDCMQKLGCAGDTRKIKRFENDSHAPIACTGASVAYVDACTATIRFGDQRPKVSLAKKIACPQCGCHARDWPSESLVCKSCAEPDDRKECCHCGERTDEAYWVNDGAWCPRCYGNHCFCCDHCSEYFEGEGVSVGDATWCDDCVSNDATLCDECSHHVRDYNTVETHYGTWCCDCAEATVACAGCSVRFTPDDLTDGYCEDCQPEEAESGMTPEEVYETLLEMDAHAVQDAVAVSATGDGADVADTGGPSGGTGVSTAAGDGVLLCSGDNSDAASGAC